MKLSILPLTLSASLCACGEPDVADESSLKLEAGTVAGEETLALTAEGSAGETEAVEVENDVERAADHHDDAVPITEAALGRPAPGFELKDLTGKLHKLSRHKGKTIVLEWFNPDCPFIVNAHEEGPLKEMVARHQAEGVVWIAINSGASGKQGADPRKNVNSTQEWKMRYPILFDPTGDVGGRYGAKTTPHMFVIDQDFILRYEGALDNAPMGKAEGDYTNFVEGAIEAIAEGQPCPPSTDPYGCGIKYGD